MRRTFQRIGRAVGPCRESLKLQLAILAGKVVERFRQLDIDTDHVWRELNGLRHFRRKRHRLWCGLDRNLEDLHARVHRGAYRALPSRRRYIQKPDGRQRPLAIAALEDKIVQRAVVAILQVIYEEAFLGCSYGFRPGRSHHDALDALATGILRQPINWGLDLDVVRCFDSFDRT